MINDETRRKLREIQLDEMIHIIESQGKEPLYGTMSFDERLKLITRLLYLSRKT